jgi:nicotinate-nucleotide adenylyltransferase
MTTASTSIAVFGGSFDPPHVGHLLAVEYVLAIAAFERAIVVPVCDHAFGKRMAPFEDRLTLARACFGHDTRVEVSAIEAELPRPNYTERTLERLHALVPGASFGLVLGSDVLPETAHWHDFPRVRELAPPFVLTRAGYEEPELPPPVLPEVSSTHVRELLGRRAEAEAGRRLAALVPRRVLEAIEARGLYR